MLSFKQFIIVIDEATTIDAGGQRASGHIERYVKPFLGKEELTHELAKNVGHLTSGEKVRLHSHFVKNGKHHVVISGEDGIQIETPVNSLYKQDSVLKRKGDAGFKKESEMVETLKKEGLMDPNTAPAGSTGGVDFHLVKKKKQGEEKVGGQEADTLGGESKISLKAKMGAVALKHTKERGWHVSDKTRAEKPELTREFERSTVNGKPILDHLNDHWGDPSEGNPLSQVTTDTSGMGPVHAYMRDHKAHVLHIHSHGTFRSGDSEHEDQSGIGLPAPEGTGRFTIGQERKGGAVHAAYRVHSRGFKRSHVDLMNPEHREEIKKKLGH